jgi:phage tail-like protein
MAVSPPRERPFVQFNFLVDIGNGTTGAAAGFQEVSGLVSELTVSEYRPGNYKFNNTQMITGMNKSGPAVLKRGIIGAADLFLWLNDIRNGNQNARRTVRIQLLSEDRTTTVLTWTLLEARITKHTSGPLNAKGTDVAMEEMTLHFERLEVE